MIPGTYGPRLINDLIVLSSVSEVASKSQRSGERWQQRRRHEELQRAAESKRVWGLGRGLLWDCVPGLWFRLPPSSSSFCSAWKTETRGAARFSTTGKKRMKGRLEHNVGSSEGWGWGVFRYIEFRVKERSRDTAVLIASGSFSYFSPFSSRRVTFSFFLFLARSYDARFALHVCIVFGWRTTQKITITKVINK